MNIFRSNKDRLFKAIEKKDLQAVQQLITKNGVWNLENMVYDELVADEVYEFLFIFTPIRFKGATGSPGRPIGIHWWHKGVEAILNMDLTPHLSYH